jgi:sugar phosphate isomerase/epimerase
MVIDLLLENTDPSLVKFEFDTYWAARGGADPVAWMRKLGSRCDLIHQKDRPATARPVNWFDAFGAGSTITLDNLIKTQGTDQFTEVGEGEMDIAAIVRVARELGFARYIFVEQDVSGRGELESIGISYNALSRILAAN